MVFKIKKVIPISQKFSSKKSEARNVRKRANLINARKRILNLNRVLLRFRF
jgi:hypothetical protein